MGSTTKRGNGNRARRFLEARSVAIIGASRTPGKSGFEEVDNLRRANYSGAVYPVNPKAEEIAGYRCYPSLDAVPEPVELAIILRPAEDAMATFEACIAKRVPAVLIPASGFSEGSPEGAKLQAQIVALAQASDIAVWGPNCGGFVNTANGLHASINRLHPARVGGVSIIAQSGVYVAGVFNQSMERPGFGVSIIATLGNACDLSPAEVMEYLAEDPATSVIALHLEGLRDGDRLLRMARELAGHKPIIATLPGSTNAGRRASLTHTGNLAVDGRIAEGLLLQAGIVPAREFPDLIELAHAFSVMASPHTTRRVAVVSTSGAAGVICADYVDRAGLELAQFSPETQAQLDALHPLTWGMGNPVDPAMAMERYGTAEVMPEIADAIFSDPAVDAVVFGMGAYGGTSDTFDPASMIGAAKQKHGKPAVAWLYGPANSLDLWRISLQSIGMPSFLELQGAVSALGGLERIYHCTEMSGCETLPISERELTVARTLVDSARRKGRGILTEPEALSLLREWGIPVIEHAVVNDEQTATAAAAELGYPLVLKAVSPDILHKADVGAVITGIANEAELRAAWQTISQSLSQSAPRAQLDGMPIQRMASGREIIVGITPAPGVGQVVMAGVGGILVEVHRDVAFRLPPLDKSEAQHMLDESGAGALLEAHRGQPPADRQAVCDTLVQLARLAAADTGLAEIEVNPLMVAANGAGVLAVDALAILDT